MSGNIGYMYYKDYFKGVDWRGFGEDDWKSINKVALQRKSQAIINSMYIKDSLNSNDIANQSLVNVPLKACPPGLLVGSGVNHEAGIEGEFKLGIYFDYTSGYPYIPGSSVKGVLRNAFKHLEYIEELFKEFGWQTVDVALLEKEIFSGIKNGARLKMSERDCFLDAHIISVPRKLLNDDYITPHKHKNNPALDPFANPTPIRFLKVEPGVEFGFQFILHNSDTLEAEQKKELFKKIMCDLGIGAKTAVGYGYFQE